MTELEGLKELQEKLKYFKTIGAKKIGGRAVIAGAYIIRNAIQNNSPGTIPREVGIRRTQTQGNVQGAVTGLGVARAEQRVARPHGHFLTLGTRFIAPRNFVRNAISSSIGAAANAMQNAAEKELKKLKAKS